ncbi:hypothetical protein C0992_001671, partial [Termitomyces sp. T32_za158]
MVVRRSTRVSAANVIHTPVDAPLGRPVTKRKSMSRKHRVNKRSVAYMPVEYPSTGFQMLCIEESDAENTEEPLDLDIPVQFIYGDTTVHYPIDGSARKYPYMPKFH